MPTARRLLGAAATTAALLGVATVLVFTVFRRPVERLAIQALEPPYEAPPGSLEPVFDGPDRGLTALGVSLEPVVEGLAQPTDVQFVPGEPAVAVVTQKAGVLAWVDVSNGERGELGTFEVLTVSEQGLLGAAFHPRFPEVRELFLNLVRSVQGKDTTEVLRCAVVGERVRGGAVGECDVVLSQEQPYQNHNAGQLAFGPDGMLYIGFGDGGLRDDPLKQGQDPSTWLGSLIRIDVDGRDGELGYAVPPDNPYVGRQGYAPETWAFGLRNPWRFHFAPDGQLVVADVGQDTWEEVDLVERGDNLGWSAREGQDCFPLDEPCQGAGYKTPIWTYGRESGSSVTGGVVVTGEAAPGLRGRYLVGDFVSGRIWALKLPESNQVDPPLALGRWPVLVSTFARDAAGNAYVAGYGRGAIYRVVER